MCRINSGGEDLKSHTPEKPLRKPGKKEEGNRMRHRYSVRCTVHLCHLLHLCTGRTLIEPRSISPVQGPVVGKITNRQGNPLSGRQWGALGHGKDENAEALPRICLGYRQLKYPGLGITSLWPTQES